jgi:hypothetical protein
MDSSSAVLHANLSGLEIVICEHPPHADASLVFKIDAAGYRNRARELLQKYG